MLNVSLVIGLCVSYAQSVSAQVVSSSLGWTVAMPKADFLTSPPGGFRLLGNHQQLELALTLANVGTGGLTSLEPLESALRASVRRGADDIAVALTEITCSPVGVTWVAAAGAVRCRLFLRRANNDPFDVGVYVLTLDLSSFIDGARTDAGTPWVGQVPRSGERRIIVDAITTREDRVRYLSIEGNYQLHARNLPLAISHLEELIRLAPDDWQGHAALGAAYQRSGRPRDAIVPFERALALRRDSSVVVGALVIAYLSIGAENDAIRTLRNSGLTEHEATSRVQSLRSGGR